MEKNCRQKNISAGFLRLKTCLSRFQGVNRNLVHSTKTLLSVPFIDKLLQKRL